ncbi:MAG TPA: T9SS type A sorting domain-containing protein [Bacteroidales bacterium]|nr:T9SS type A sorting domain-containing protein [Bacteroidales bacterium]
MKKAIFLILGMVAFGFVMAQTVPTNWTITTSALTAVEETGDVSDGSKAALMTWTSVDNQDIDSDPIAVTAGASFSASVDVLDNDPAGRCRIGIFWGTDITPPSNYATGYSADGVDWQTNTLTGTVPAGATTAVIRIRFYDVTAGWAGTASVIIDNIVYTENGGANLLANASLELWGTVQLNPELNVTSPANNAIVNADNVSVVFEVANFELGTDGEVEYILNSGAPSYTTTSPINISGLTEGNNTIQLQLVDMEGTALDPAVLVTLNVIYEIPSTDPTITITSPTEGQNINSDAVNITFTVANFDLGTEGKVAISVDGGATTYQTNTNAIALTGLSYAEHTVELELVDMSNNALDPAVTDVVTFTCVETTPGGMEPFDNSTATATYGDGSFVGNNDITWNYYHSRNEGDYPINGTGLMLRRASDSKLESGQIPGGIASFEVKMRKAFTGSTARQLELYINGQLAGTSESFGAFTGADETIYTFAVDNINVAGSFTMMIKCVGESDFNSQITIDDISWTQFSSTEPYLYISSPANNATINTTDVNVAFNVTNFDLGTEGRVKYVVDGGSAQYTTASPIALTGLSEALHTVALELVDMSNNPLSPAVTAQVSFTVNTSVPEYNTIYSIQYTTEASGDSPLVGQEVTTRGVVVAKNGDKFWIQDGVGAWNGVYVYFNTTPSPAVGDSVWVNGTVAEYNNLTEISFATFTLINSGNTIGAPAEITTADASAEMYEGVLVQIEGVNSAAPDSYGQWAVNDGSGAILVDDLLYDYTPVLGNTYNVTGVADFAFSERKLLPRDAADVIDLGVSSTPMLSITSPANASTVYSAGTTAVFTVSNFTLGTDGKIAYQLDGGSITYITTTTAAITGMTDGSHTLNAQLVNMSNAPLSPAVTATSTFTVDLSGPDITPIYDIQFSETSPYASPLVNQTVTIEGVVTASFNGTPYGEGYFVQDDNGAWNGLYIFDLNNTPAIGDKVMVTGKVSEYFEMTELTTISYYQVTSIGEVVPPPVVVTTAAAGTEMYESVLIKVQNAECMTLQNTYGEWTVNDGSGALTCKDNGAFTFQEVVGTHYDIIGVMLYSYGAFTLNYRIPSDVVESTAIETELSRSTTIYPNPATDVIQVVSELPLKSLSIVTPEGKTVYSSEINSFNGSIDISSLASGLYFIRIEGENGFGIKKLIVE